MTRDYWLTTQFGLRFWLTGLQYLIIGLRLAYTTGLPAHIHGSLAPILGLVGLTLDFTGLLVAQTQKNGIHKASIYLSQ